MPDILLILLGTVAVNHLALSGQLDPRWRPAPEPYRETRLLAALSAVVMLTAAPLVTAIDHWLTLLAAESLQLLALVAISAGMAASARAIARRVGLVLSGKVAAFGTSNGAALLLAWQLASAQAAAGLAIFFAISLAAAFGALLLAFTALMERTAAAEVPASFRGAPLTLIVAGLTALALLGLAGLLPD